jgi:hypothetical protein
MDGLSHRKEFLYIGQRRWICYTSVIPPGIVHTLGRRAIPDDSRSFERYLWMFQGLAGICSGSPLSLQNDALTIYNQYCR